MTSVNEYSKWALLDRLYKAKKHYYQTDKPSMYDHEYDALERSIVEIHGSDFFKKWYCVGYDPDKHKIIKENKHATSIRVD